MSLWPTVGKGVFMKSNVERALREGSNVGSRRRREGSLHEVSQSWDAAKTWEYGDKGERGQRTKCWLTWKGRWRGSLGTGSYFFLTTEWGAPEQL